MSSKNNDQNNIFKVDFEVGNPVGKGLLKVFKKPLESFLDFKTLNEIHQGGVRREGEDDFSQKLLDVMNITLKFDERCLERIPKTGPVVFVANHPFGGIEGVILGAILKRVRPDIKIMANQMLERIPELRDIFIFVNPFESKSAARENLKSMKETIRHLENGGALGVFPAGAVSHRTWSRKEIVDPEWSHHITRIIRKIEAPVVPIFFGGSNGKVFQWAGLVHPLLRTALLPRQFSNKKNKTISVAIGKVIPKNKINSFPDEKELTRYLRQRTYLLQTFADSESCDPVSKNESTSIKKQSYEQIIDAIPSELLLEDIKSLEKGQLLLNNNEYDVYYAAYRQIPNIIREIGRLRELTFRNTEEGTGKSIDLDEYDKHYMHMFVWHREKQEIVGAYRLGRTDNIMKKIGPSGLYTTTLFKIKRSLLEQISPALEMGRSFVRPEYQRSFAPLLLLWKGIGHYVVKYPKYKILFGPVSISNDYETGSRNLLVTFLKLNNYLPDFAKQVKPKTPFKQSSKTNWLPFGKTQPLIDIDDISDAISHVEADAKGVPILIKQYLKLGGKLLGFNVDPDFADALDGLILVDLSQTDPKILSRYMGDEGIISFQNYHKNKEAGELKS